MKNNLKQVREDYHITQAKLAEEIGVSAKTISAWEMGTRSPKPREMQKMEDLFDVPKEKIFFGAFSYIM